MGDRGCFPGLPPDHLRPEGCADVRPNRVGREGLGQSPAHPGDPRGRRRPGFMRIPIRRGQGGGRGVFNSSSRIESHGSSRCCCCSTSRCSHAVSARSTSGEMTDDACFCDEPRRSCAAFLAFLADSWESCGSFRRTASFCGMCWLGVCAIVYITFRDTIGERPRHAAHCCFRPAAPHCRASPRS